MLEMILQSTLLIAALIALRPMLKRWLSARALYALWLLPALRMMLPFSFQSALSLLNAARPIVQRAEQIVQSPVLRAAESAAAPTSAAADFMPAASIPAAPTAAAGATVQDMLFWIWLAGAALMLGYMVLVNLRIRRRMTGRAQFMGASKGLPVYLAQGISSPCLMGVIRPKILMPASAATDPKVRDMALHHELAHYRRRDNWWALLRNGLLCVYWFNPLVWVAAALSRADCEKACDELAMRGMKSNSRTAYGMALIAMLRDNPLRSGEMLVSGSTMMSNGKKLMKERIMLIAAKRKTRIGLTALAAAITAFAVLLTCSSAESGNSPDLSRDSVSAEPTPVATEPTPVATEPTQEPLTAIIPPQNDVGRISAAYEAQYPWLTFADMPAYLLSEALTSLDGLEQHYEFTARMSTDGSVRYILGVSADETDPFEGLNRTDSTFGPDGLQDAYYFHDETQPRYVLKNTGLIHGSGLLFVVTDAENAFQIRNIESLLAGGYLAELEDCAARGTTIAEPPAPYLKVNTLRGYHTLFTEYIPLTVDQVAQAAGEATISADLYGHDALHLNTGDGNDALQSRMAESLVRLAQEKCHLDVAVPDDVGTIVAAQLDALLMTDGEDVCTQQITDRALLKELERMLQEAEPTYLGKCPFTATLTLEMADGRTLELRKSTDSCPQIVFGSIGSYELNNSDNARFWEIFDEIGHALGFDALSESSEWGF